MPAIRFIMIGGFLGAGKTTTLLRLARRLIEHGNNVGVVTNDQADNLVDTHTFRAHGITAEEVPGACFCCKFNDLVETAGRLSAASRPDVILAEPVGSCTDLVATVVEPLRHLHAGQYELAPFVVLCKPEHARKILANQPKGGFSPKAAYIFRKQLEEADCIAINKIDALSGRQRDEMAELVQEHFPGTDVLAVSARTGAGFERLEEVLSRSQQHHHIPDVDYDIYAEGEAELGWHNSAVTLTAPQPLDLDALLLDVIGRLGATLSAEDAEIAHLKAIGLYEGFFGVANATSNDTPPELSLPSGQRAPRLELIVNARVAIEPAALEQHVRAAVDEAAAALGARAEFGAAQSFRPGRPVPTHRYASSP